VRQRTQAVNALRAHLAELGIIVAVGMTKVAALVAIVRDETDARLPPAGRFALLAVVDQIDARQTRLTGLSAQSSLRRSETRTCAA
jgi:transposase